MGGLGSPSNRSFGFVDFCFDDVDFGVGGVDIFNDDVDFLFVDVDFFGCGRRFFCHLFWVVMAVWALVALLWLSCARCCMCALGDERGDLAREAFVLLLASRDVFSLRGCSCRLGVVELEGDSVALGFVVVGCASFVSSSFEKLSRHGFVYMMLSRSSK